MLSKLLLTIILITVAVLLFLHRRSAQQPAIVTAAREEPDDSQWMVKGFAYGLVSLMLLTGSVLYYLNWRDSYRIIEIRIINPQTGKADIYQTYKKDMHGHQFTTIAGQQIIVSGLERMEYSELP